MNSRFVLAAAALFAAASVPVASFAATATGSFQVTASVQGSCTVSASNLAFGAYSSAAATAGTTSIVVNCVGNTPYNIALDSGANGTLNGGSTIRAMAATGGSTLSYNLYSDAGHNNVWANGGAVVTGDANPSTTTTVYGLIPAGQSSPQGSYTDTVNVTLNY